MFDFNCRLFCVAGGKDGVVNPMVNNMAPAYDNAKYDIVWVSTSRIKGKITETFLSFISYIFKGSMITRTESSVPIHSK